MDTGQLVYIISRLVLGALAVFFAIMLWSKTRDAAWMFVVFGAIALYAETVYSILGLFGITGTTVIADRRMPLLAILLPNLPTIFLLAAFVVMVIRKYREMDQ